MKRSYDFVIVGAGSAGIGAAYSLALKYPNSSILMLEQGSNLHTAPLFSRCPALQPFLSWSRKAKPYLREYKTAPDAGADQRSLRVRKGKGLGGSSIVDEMRCIRGTKADYAGWSSPTWSWEAMTSAFRRVERNSRGGSDIHGGHGLLPVTDPGSALASNGLNVRFYQACECSGLPDSHDFNDGVADGQGTFQSFIHRGTRADLFTCLIDDEKHRTPNLDVKGSSFVRRLVLDAKSKKCTHVVVDGQPEPIEVGVAVLCAAGAIETPALLLRSGIGASDTLRDASIPQVVENAQVGRNLIAPPSVDLVFGFTSSMTRTRCLSLDNLSYMRDQWKEYEAERTGSFTSLIEAGAWVRSKDTLEKPDLLLTLACTPIFDRGEKLPLKKGFTVTATHFKPQSRGMIQISAETGRAEIATKTFDAEGDIEALDEGVMWAGLLCGPNSNLQSPYYEGADDTFRPPFENLTPRLLQPRRPVRTEAESLSFLRNAAYLGGNMFGTCAMGKVVNESLQVTGAPGVMIVDSSVVPQPICGTSGAVSLNIGIRAAEFV